eukprot:scaffold9382_cov36-Cyclotella_meneghiniana.AAC.1
MKFTSAATMRGRMVRHYGMCWYEKRPHSTTKLFGNDAVVESGDKLEIHCGSSRLNGYLYRKTGMKGDEEETFRRAMSTMWKERSSILQDVGLPSAAPKEVLKSGIKLASNLPTLKSDNKNGKKDGEHIDANQFREQYLRGFQRTAHIIETPTVEKLHGQPKDRMADIPVNPQYNASRRLSGGALSHATKPTSKNKMSVATTKGATKPTSTRERKDAGKGKKPRKRPRTGKGKGKQNERGKKKRNEEISESESSDDSYELKRELKRNKKPHQESYKESLASVYGDEDEASTDSWDVGSLVEGENKVWDVVAADYCSLEQIPMLLCMWKGYTAEEYMSWEPLQTIQNEQKHRRE